MNKTTDFDEKVRVFISSKCGVDNYDKVRLELKSKIEGTGFAKVYLFEDGGRASTLSAEQDYLYALDDSDVCIFLIDNAGDIPKGVLKEYQRAKSQSKKSFYIFCNQNEKEPTYIEKEIKTARGEKCYTTKSFEEFVNVGYQSLINDIGDIYISYCKGRLIDPEFKISSGNIEEIDAVATESLDKQIFKNTDKTKNIINREIFRRTDIKFKNTCDFDTNCSSFLDVIFGYKKITEFNTYFLLSSLSDMQSENLHKLVTERWKAIQHYWMDDLDKAIEYENQSLDLARKLRLPNWLIQDILIDLNNLYIFKGQKENRYTHDSESQLQLDNERSGLFYPLLDRYEKSLLQEIINQTEKASIKSPYSVTLGNSISLYGEYISNIYIMAVFNGSLTHLLRIFDRIKNVAFNLCNEFSDWEFRVLLIKIAISKGNKKDLKGLIDLFNDVYGKMNAKDAKIIYEFSKSNPIKHQRNMAQLLSLQHLGYFFTDIDYSIIENEILEISDNWIDSDTRIVALGDYIFDSINENLLRMDNNQVVSNIILKVFEKGLLRFYDKVLETIIRLDFDKVIEENIISIVDLLIGLVNEKTEEINYYKLERAIISTRLKNLKLTECLNEIVIKVMPEFFENSYALETQMDSQSKYEEYINKLIVKIRDRNDSQGKNGVYSGYLDNPYKTIERIISIKDIKIGQEIVSSIISVCKDTLYSEKQMLSSKVSATNLISYIKIITDKEMFDFEQLIKQLKENEELIFRGKNDMFLDKISKSTLYFNFIMMKLAFNSVKLEDIIVVLSSNNQSEEFDKLEALKTIEFMFEYEKTENIDERIMLLILQFALGLTNDKNHDIRYHGVKVLLYIITDKNKVPIIKRLIDIMDYDSIFIKSLILNNFEKLKGIDNDAYSFIMEKALIDNHYVIRKRALTIQQG